MAISWKNDFLLVIIIFTVYLDKLVYADHGIVVVSIWQPQSVLSKLHHHYVILEKMGKKLLVLFFASKKVLCGIIKHIFTNSQAKK